MFKGGLCVDFEVGRPAGSRGWEATPPSKVMEDVHEAMFAKEAKPGPLKAAPAPEVEGRRHLPQGSLLREVQIRQRPF